MSNAAAKLKVAPPAEDDPKPKAELRARNVRRQRARRLGMLLAIFVGVPTLLAIVYYGFWASPQYESVAVFAVHSSEPVGKGKLAKRASSKDAQLVREYVQSRSMLDHLIKSHDFLGKYRTPSADRWSRLPADASTEELYAYFLDKVVIKFDTESQTLKLTVRAYSGEDAQQLGLAVVASSETLLASLSESAQQQVYLMMVAAPSRSNGSTYPKRAWGVATVAVVSFMLMGILLLLGAAIREHAKF